MEIGVKQAAELLNVSDKTIYRWVSGAQIPFYRVGAQYRFSRNELLSWVTTDQSAEVGAVQVSNDHQVLSLEESLRAGGIFYRVGGADVRQVFEQMLDLMRLPASADSAQIQKRLYERELITTTGVGNGIAFPHCRELALPGLLSPMIALGFLEQAVDFLAVDRKPVNVLFVLLSPSSSSSIRIMSRLAHAVQRPSFVQLLREEASREALFKAVRGLDHELNS